MRSLRLSAFAIGALVLAGAAGPSRADSVYNGITFPQGDLSFADGVVGYDPAFSGGAVPTIPEYLDPTTALGPPDYNSIPDTGSVSLGDGGRITLRFTDNALTGSGDGALDLHIFEVGSDVEDTAVEISTDGTIFISVGAVIGATSSIDIDPFISDALEQYFYVRLTDLFGVDSTAGSSVGADIDAVGAITTVAVQPPGIVPTPAASALGAVLLGLVSLRRRRVTRAD